MPSASTQAKPDAELADEALLRGLFDAGPHPIAVLDLDGVVVRANVAARALRPPFAVGAPWGAWWGAEGHDAAAGALDNARQGAAGAFEAVGADARRWQTLVMPLRDPDGRTRQLLATSRDVAEEAAARDLVASLRRRTDALVAATAEVVWRADAAQQNSEFHGENGRYPDWASERPQAWFDGLHPDDRPRVAARIHEGMASGRTYANEYRLRDEAGAWRWVEDRAVPVCDDHGAVTEWIGVVSDIHDRKVAEDALRASEERLRIAVEASQVGIWDVDLVTGERQWSAELKSILGLTPDAAESGPQFLDRVHADDRSLFEEPQRGEVLRSGQMERIEARITRADTGEQRWIVSSGRVFRDDAGRRLRRVGTLQDITEQRRAEFAARRRERHLLTALQVGRMVIWDRDARTGVVSRSENATEIIGNTREHMSAFAARVHPDDRPKVIWEPSISPSPPSGSVQFRYRHPDGRDLWLETTALRVADEDEGRRVVGITVDITERKLAELELVRAATRDPLTGLLNRMAFAEELDRAIASARVGGTRLDLFLVDVDALKTINDSFGHDAGDAVLLATARTLEAAGFDCVARLSGDEFAALAARAGTQGGASAMARRALDDLARPLSHKGRTLAIGASVGIASFPEHADAARDLMKDADLALYAAKRAGRRRAEIFHPDLRTAVDDLNALKAQLRGALSSDRILPFYQPKIDLATGAVVGFEALARWSHPVRGTVTPAVFGPVFEDAKLAVAIGRVMLDRVLDDLRAWLDRDIPVGRIAINCTSHDFRSGDFASLILRQLEAKGVPAHHFELEVTEGVMMNRDAGLVAEALGRLHTAGVAISLDDFGTGYASLVHLRMFPVDAIKIDKSFVADIGATTNTSLVEAIVGMGRVLGLAVVAEGVENDAQADALLGIGCPYAQGFRFGKPMHAARVPRFVLDAAARRTAPPGRPAIAG